MYIFFIIIIIEVIIIIVIVLLKQSTNGVTFHVYCHGGVMRKITMPHNYIINYILCGK